jgi:hypothetical protein
MLDQLISCSFVLFEQLEAKPVAKLSPWATLACSVSLQGVSFELSTPVVPGGMRGIGFSSAHITVFFNVSFDLRHQYPECFK